MCSDCCDDFSDEEYYPVNPTKNDKEAPPDDGEGMYNIRTGTCTSANGDGASDMAMENL